MKDWKQEIAELIRNRCDHGPDSDLVSPGCPDCQGLFLDVVWTIDRALDGLAESVRDQIAGDPAGLIEEFKRSIPTG